MLISAYDWPHLQHHKHTHYHPDTKPLVPFYQAKHPKHPHNEPRFICSHDPVSRSIGVRIIHEYGIWSASPSITHTWTSSLECGDYSHITAVQRHYPNLGILEDTDYCKDCRLTALYVKERLGWAKSDRRETKLGLLCSCSAWYMHEAVRGREWPSVILFSDNRHFIYFCYIYTQRIAWGNLTN